MGGGCEEFIQKVMKVSGKVQTDMFWLLSSYSRTCMWISDKRLFRTNMFDSPAGELLHATKFRTKDLFFYCRWNWRHPPKVPPVGATSFLFFVRQVKPLSILAMKMVEVKPAPNSSEKAFQWKQKPIPMAAKSQFQQQKKANSNDSEKQVPITAKSKFQQHWKTNS